MEEHINLGKWSEEELGRLIMQASGLSHVGERINYISKQFLNVPYEESTLIGNSDEPENFVINLESIDCFTFLDYVEAMRLSKSFDEFKECLKSIRYQKGTVQFENRNHFFISWRKNNSDFVEEITASIGNSVLIDKQLNNRGDGTLFLPGVACSRLTINYIPSEYITEKVTDNLTTGDYVGIYSDKPGLDVSHVGIFIRDNGCNLLRHASQKHQKVVDEDFKEYIKSRPGVIVLRPKR